MDLQDDIDFDTWFDLFIGHAQIQLCYTGAIDKYSFEWNYEEGQTPESAAEEFVKEMRE